MGREQLVKALVVAAGMFTVAAVAFVVFSH